MSSKKFKIFLAIESLSIPISLYWSSGLICSINLSGNFSRPRIVICIPSSCSSLEQRAVKEAAENSNASEVYLIKEPMAAAIGLGIDVSSSTGHMIVDIGGGTTEIAVIALNGIVSLKAIKLAGDKQTVAIKDWLHDNHQLQIGIKMAETIRKKLVLQL